MLWPTPQEMKVSDRFFIETDLCQSGFTFISRLPAVPSIPESLTEVVKLAYPIYFIKLQCV